MCIYEDLLGNEVKTSHAPGILATSPSKQLLDQYGLRRLVRPSLSRQVIQNARHP